MRPRAGKHRAAARPRYLEETQSMMSGCDDARVAVLGPGRLGQAGS